MRPPQLTAFYIFGGWAQIANLVMAATDPQQIRQHRNTKGLLDAPLLPPYLLRPQPQVGPDFPPDLLPRPSSLIGTDQLSQRPPVQSGHPYVRLCRAAVT